MESLRKKIFDAQLELISPYNLPEDRPINFYAVCGRKAHRKLLTECGNHLNINFLEINLTSEEKRIINLKIALLCGTHFENIRYIGRLYGTFFALDENSVGENISSNLIRVGFTPDEKQASLGNHVCFEV